MHLPPFIPIRRDPLVINHSLSVDLRDMEPHEALNAIEVAKYDAGCLAREILGDLNRAEMAIRNSGPRAQAFAPDGAASLCRSCTGAGVKPVTNAKGTPVWEPCDACAGTGLDTPVVLPAE